MHLTDLDEGYLGVVAKMPGIESLGLVGAVTARGIAGPLRPLANLEELSLANSRTGRTR